MSDQTPRTPRPQTVAEFEALRAQLLGALVGLRLDEAGLAQAETIARQLSPVSVPASVLDASADQIVVLEFPETTRPPEILELCTLIAEHTPAQVIAVSSGGGAKVMSIARTHDPIAIDILETVVTTLERSEDPDLQGMAAIIRREAHDSGLPIAPPDLDEDEEDPAQPLLFPGNVTPIGAIPWKPDTQGTPPAGWTPDLVIVDDPDSEGSDPYLAVLAGLPFVDSDLKPLRDLALPFGGPGRLVIDDPVDPTDVDDAPPAGLEQLASIGSAWVEVAEAATQATGSLSSVLTQLTSSRPPRAVEDLPSLPSGYRWVRSEADSFWSVWHGGQELFGTQVLDFDDGVVIRRALAAHGLEG